MGGVCNKISLAKSVQKLFLGLGHIRVCVESKVIQRSLRSNYYLYADLHFVMADDAI